MTADRTIPGFKLLHLLGRGNSSLVHLALDTQGQPVALKIPLEETLRMQEAAERFSNEVRLTLQFQHPHLVEGYAGTPFGPRAFVALRYYPEGTLADVLADRDGERLPLEEALRILADVAAGLTYLHGLGAVHQDVKTQNVYVDSGRAALGDLGSTYLTAQGGQSSGSPYYMAPEIYHGQSSSAASDVYSLGVLAYELLGGQRPHQGETYEELMVAHLTRYATPLPHLNPQVPRIVARLVELALAKRSQDRPKAEALRRTFLAALGEMPGDETAEDSCGSVTATTARQVGRHGQSTLPEAPSPGTADAGERGGPRWNPFRRRK